ncbi:[protein-PII] uridylyltransferase [Puniceibacterium sp. IMCC21224]|uniref:[protein-PII] uridylyltransferase n=1 Tax=Puniceibacterium sp. IMCC21224 TaxID=1618204 RepID=UPI00065CEA85|nr:[protein-PII] uridylyltransferase [Puniceibacterium sp. IMCC21224]KMK66041.1 UTP--GlnB (protein PII) uridylyltransferase, GlnD [Puniceibacterium sp. IMCC21224]
MTLPQEASAAPDSDVFDATVLPDDLIAPAEAIFDRTAIRKTLWNAIQGATDERSVRAACVQILGDARDDGRIEIAKRFAQRPFAAGPATRSYTWITDCLVTLTWEVAIKQLHPLSNPTKGEQIAVIAVGGYGRGEMAPQSDVDLLFLTPYKITAWAESVIESMLYILWDLKLKVGHASRTVKDCLRLGAEDYTIRTAMLEHRFLIGEAALAQDLDARLWNELFTGTIRDFVTAKLAERDARHEKQGGQRYVVEPNVKEGKGGLRDLQSLFWITKYIHHTDDIGEMMRLGVFRPEEYNTFVKAENFLWSVRCHLHLIAGRAMEQLTFDMQVAVAEAMGYTDRGSRRAVEIFMHEYFRHATAVGDLTRIFLTSLEAEHIKDAPLLARFFNRRPPKVGDGYQVINGRINPLNEKAFLADKMNLLRIFQEALRTGLLIHPDAMRLIVANLKLIDEDMRQSKEAQQIFLDLLLKHGNPDRALRRMNELGVLGAFIPEFELIVAMMQFNMYHHYTVDEHTIQCIWNLSEIENCQLVEELPVASLILKEGINRKVLYVAMLLHDIGKGRDEDHSILGAQIARRVAPRLGLSAKDSATVEWLVRHHLLMSDMAQKRDIADPRTVRDFAKAVQTRERLDLLLLLTVCDIRGVGPGTWNNWKAALLRALYRQTRDGLENGMEALNRERRGAEAKTLLREALSDWDAKDLRTEKARHYPPYWQGLHVTAHVVFARLLRDIGPGEIGIDIHPDEERDATRVCFALDDHPGIFSRLAGAVSLAGANVVDARTYTSKDGFATAAFWIQDGDGSPYDAIRLPRLRDVIGKALRGELGSNDLMRSKDKLKKRERAFKVPTSIIFDNDGSEIYTIIEVDTRDRPGLLYDLTRTLAASHVYIASAVIATYGEQVVDSFYVKDMFGLKYHTVSKQKMLERKLRAAIDAGVERATS